MFNNFTITFYLSMVMVMVMTMVLSLDNEFNRISKLYDSMESL